MFSCDVRMMPNRYCHSHLWPISAQRGFVMTAVYSGQNGMSSLFWEHDPANMAASKVADATGAVHPQSQAQIHGAMPGSDAVQTAGVADGRRLFAVDQAVHF